MIRTPCLVLVAAALARTGWLLGPVGGVIGSNVSKPSNDPEMQAEQDFHDGQTRAGRDHLASRNC